MNPSLLILVRHAQAEPQSGRLRDFDRALTPIGRAQAERAGCWLAGRLPDIDTVSVVVSPAQRTRQTAEVLLDGWHVGDVGYDERIWEASTGDLLSVVGDSDRSRLMLVGHNPGIEQLQHSLTGALAPASVGSIHVLSLDPEHGARRTDFFDPTDKA